MFFHHVRFIVNFNRETYGILTQKLTDNQYIVDWHVLYIHVQPTRTPFYNLNRLHRFTMLPSNFCILHHADTLLTWAEIHYPRATRCGGDIVTLLWFRPSVRPSVRRPCEHDRDYILAYFFVKLDKHVNHNKRMNPIDFGGQRSKVNVTMDLYGNKLVNRIETTPLHILCQTWQTC